MDSTGADVTPSTASSSSSRLDFNNRRIGVACSVCRSQKLWWVSSQPCCEAQDASTEGGRPCERCRRAGHECIYDVAKAPTKTKDNTLSQRTSSLEQRLAALELAAVPNAHLRLSKLEQVAFPRVTQPRRTTSGSDTAPSPSSSGPYASKLTSQFLLNPVDDRLFKLTRLEEVSATVPEYSATLWQIEIRNPTDIVNAGIIPLDKARAYWDRFHDVAAFRMGWTDGHKMVVHVREEAPLFFAACCSVGAASSGDFYEGHLCLEEAKIMAEHVLFIDTAATKGTELGDLKALLVMCVFWNMPRLVGSIVSLCHHLSLPKVFAKLTDVEIRGSANEADLIKKGRLWLLCYVYCNIICVMTNEPVLFHTEHELIKQQAEVLRASAYAQTEIDACISLHCEYVSILSGIQSAVNAGRERARIVPAYSDILDEWWAHWSQPEGGVFHTKDMSYFLTAYQLARAYIHRFAYTPVQRGEDVFASTEMHMAAHTAVQCAKSVLTAALLPKTQPPTFGLAVEFHLTGLPLCCATIFELALALPGTFDTVELAELLVLVMGVFYNAENSAVHETFGDLAFRLSSLSTAVEFGATPMTVRAPQKIDGETRRLLAQLQSSATFRSGVFSEGRVAVSGRKARETGSEGGGAASSGGK